MSCPNADLIAVSLAFLKDLKNLLQKVVRALCSAKFPGEISV